MTRRHVAIPEVPSNIVDWQSIILSALKEDVELLTGTRGEADLASMAIVRGDVTVQQVGRQDMLAINTSANTAPGSLSVAASADMLNSLRNDVQLLANDLYYTRQALDLLIRNLTGA